MLLRQRPIIHGLSRIPPPKDSIACYIKPDPRIGPKAPLNTSSTQPQHSEPNPSTRFDIGNPGKVTFAIPEREPTEAKARQEIGAVAADRKSVV